MYRKKGEQIRFGVGCKKMIGVVLVLVLVWPDCHLLICSVAGHTVRRRGLPSGRSGSGTWRQEDPLGLRSASNE